MDYLIIFEDGSFALYNAVGDDDFQTCSDGYIDIIRLSDMKRYNNGSWVNVPRS